MFYAGHKNVSLITFAASIHNHGIDLTAIVSDRAYLFAVRAILCAVIFGIAEIICSFFTSAKSGYKRDVYKRQHLDTVWSWDFETTVSKYIYNTLVDNFKSVSYTHLKNGRLV